MSKKIKLLLVTSLCLNVLFAGLFIGKEGRHMYDHVKKNPEMMNDLREFRNKSCQEREAVNKERRAALEIIMANDYNKAEYEKQIDKINVLQAELFKEMSLFLAERVQKMPEEKRIQLKKRLEKEIGIKRCGPKRPKK